MKLTGGGDPHNPYNIIHLFRPHGGMVQKLARFFKDIAKVPDN